MREQGQLLVTSRFINKPKKLSGAECRRLAGMRRSPQAKPTSLPLTRVNHSGTTSSNLGKTRCLPDLTLRPSSNSVTCGQTQGTEHLWQVSLLRPQVPGRSPGPDITPDLLPGLRFRTVELARSQFIPAMSSLEYHDPQYCMSHPNVELSNRVHSLLSDRNDLSVPHWAWRVRTGSNLTARCSHEKKRSGGSWPPIAEKHVDSTIGFWPSSRAGAVRFLLSTYLLRQRGPPVAGVHSQLSLMFGLSVGKQDARTALSSRVTAMQLSPPPNSFSCLSSYTQRCVLLFPHSPYTISVPCSLQSSLVCTQKLLLVRRRVEKRAASTGATSARARRRRMIVNIVGWIGRG